MNEKLIDPMEFYYYDRISDDVLFLGAGVALRFSVSLSKDRNGKRDYYYHEYAYKSKYDGRDINISIKRSYDYYLSFESSAGNDRERTFIRVGPGHFILVQNTLERIAAWFQDKKYAKLFVTLGGKLTITSNPPYERISDLPSEKYLEFIPIIIDRGIVKADKEPGVRMYLSSPDNYVDLTLEKLFGLVYIFRTFNMYQSAQEMLNYIGRPPMGTERVTLGDTKGRRTLHQDKEKEPTGITNRHIVPMTTNRSNISLLE